MIRTAVTKPMGARPGGVQTASRSLRSWLGASAQVITRPQLALSPTCVTPALSMYARRLLSTESGTDDSQKKRKRKRRKKEESAGAVAAEAEEAAETNVDEEGKKTNESGKGEDEETYHWWDGSNKYQQEQEAKAQEGFLKTPRGQKIFAGVTAFTLTAGYGFHLWVEQMYEEQREEFAKMKEEFELNRPPGVDYDIPDDLPHPYETMGEIISNAWKDIWHDVTSDQPRKLLPDPIAAPNGYVPYTLVLDLEETLLHTENSLTDGVRTAVRPGLFPFLKRASQYFEIVLFCSSDQRGVEDLCFQLDPNGQFISHRIYRSGMVQDEKSGKMVKDLSLLNRDLSRTIIIDDEPDHFLKDPNNGITISRWEDDADDVELIKILPFLEYLVVRDLDVRKELAKYQGRYIPAAFQEAGEKRLADVKKKTEGGGIKGLFSILTDSLTGGRG